MKPTTKIDGVLLVDKTSGPTSHDVVDRIRRRTGVKKAGHSGTLDPLATGLLVLNIGKATRLQAYLMGMEKVYEGEIQFGWATDSYDSAGTPMGEPKAADVSAVDFAAHLPQFRGEIEQMPPQFSAKKVQGVRAYELARKGETAALTAKKVTVYEFEMTAIEGSVGRFRIRSSAGTYVRSLAHDLGQAIGIPAHLKSLRRTAIGRFRVDDAIPFDAIEEKAPAAIFSAPHFQTLAEIDLPLEKVRIEWAQQGKLISGQAIIMTPRTPLRQSDLVALGNPDDQLVAIAEVVQVLREGGPVEVRPKVVLAG